MDPMLKLYMQFHWNEDKLEYKNILDDQAKFIGWFTNPELARKMMDATQVHTTDEEFEETSQRLHEQIKKEVTQQAQAPRRKRKKKVVNV